MHDWSLTYDAYDPQQEGLREALTTLGNGYFCTRGAISQARADDVHYPGTYLACGYNRRKTEIKGRIIENEDLVNLPNWLPIDFRLPGSDWFSPRSAELSDYRQELDLKDGVLRRSFTFKDDQERTTRVEEERLVSMDDPHQAVIRTTIVAENWFGALAVSSELDGAVENNGVERYQGLNNKHLEPLHQEEADNETLLLSVRTNQSHLEIAQAARTRFYRNGALITPRREFISDEGRVAHRIEVDMDKDKPLSVEKVVTLYTSRDHAVSEPKLEAAKLASRSGSFEEIFVCHKRAWNHLWSRFEIEFQLASEHEVERSEMILRLYIFHLLQTTSVTTMDLDVGVPSRGWHGEAYRGHIFWDELFIFPTFNYRLPEITRSLLMYRYRRLSEAKANAKESGLEGAMYPWQSGSNGREESQKLHLNPRSGRWIPDNSRLQRHVNAAICYNISQYFMVTEDYEFLHFYGAEVFLEIAKFWASITRWDNHKQRYVIENVMGPDEFHDSYPWSDQEGLNNNAYTNVMASWVLSEAGRIFEALSEIRKSELAEKLSLTKADFDKWEKMASKLYVPFHGDGIISQFEGYEELEELDWDSYKKRYNNIQRLDRILEAEDDSVNKYKASKQADVLMLFYLFTAEQLERIFDRLGYKLEKDAIPKNIDYYLSRTSHGSTLSSVVHSRVLARSNRAKSWQLFRQALRSDIEDIQGGTTPEGIHVGAMAGTVDIIQRGYTDIEPRDDVLYFNPAIPEELEKLCLRIRYRNQALEVVVTSEDMTVTAQRTAGKPIKIGYEKRTAELCSGDSKTWKLKQASRSATPRKPDRQRKGT
jgi:alpha,alpha-trehalase